MVLGWLLLHEPIVDQAMTIEYRDVVHRAWNFFRHSYDDNAESPDRSRPIVLTCRLEAARARRGDVTGVCEFDG